MPVLVTHTTRILKTLSNLFSQITLLNNMGNEVTVALLAGGFSLLSIILNKMIKESRTDHGIVRDSLNRIETKIDGHLDDHK